MEMEIKIVCYKENRRKSQVMRAIDVLNRTQDYFFFNLDLNSEKDVCDDNLINWNVICEEYTGFNEEYTIYITEKAFNDNWFSHENYRYAIITTHSWEEVFAPPSLSAYLVYQIAQAVIGFCADLDEKMSMRFGHINSKGCIFDFCGDKSDIKLGMSAGRICPNCKTSLLQFNSGEIVINAIERMLLYVRSEANGKPIIFDENKAFIIMRFSNNDENDNAYKYGIKTALKELNIECLRADDNIISGQLLEKVQQSIKKSRFIIVKVDSENLNVYFELGLAMGLGKNVLLISEQDLVLKLPSDLRNWECLTYQRGNYEGLKEKIKEYYQNGYHY